MKFKRIRRETGEHELRLQLAGYVYTVSRFRTAPVQAVTCDVCSKKLEYAEQFECSTCDRVVCRACSNNERTLRPAVRCKACLPYEFQVLSQHYAIIARRLENAGQGLLAADYRSVASRIETARDIPALIAELRAGLGRRAGYAGHEKRNKTLHIMAATLERAWNV